MVNVSPFIDSYSPVKDVKIASVVMVYDDPKTGDSIYLVLHEALYFGDKLPQTLLNPNQLQYAGNHVYDVPQHFDPYSKHAVVIPKFDLGLPMGLDGVICYLPTWKPTHEEMPEFRSQDPETWIELTSDAAWKPYSKEFEAKENCARTTANIQTGTRNVNKVESFH
jgi:hypothetical protein